MDRERIRQMTLEAARIVAQEREWHPVADAAARNDRTIEVFAQLVAGECARIVEAQDVDPTFKGRMPWAIRDRFGASGVSEKRVNPETEQDGARRSSEAETSTNQRLS